MANSEDSDIDDDFSELYKEYTGPPRSNTTIVHETTKTSKRAHADSEEEQETIDPNAVPTDFTSRDAKVWEAKSKATERNWNKRKEEEMICKLCGDPGHFTQGCPSTLGANRMSQYLFQRVPARDPQVKALFTDKVVKKIEKDIGCKIRIEEKFIIVSGKDGPILSNGVDAVHKIKDQGYKTGDSNSNTGPTDSYRSNPSPRNPSNFDRGSGRKDEMIKENAHEEFRKYPRGSPQGRVHGNNDTQSRSTRSKSPARHPLYSYGLNDNHRCGPGPDLEAHSSFSLALEELELEYKRDAIHIANVRYKEEDEENYRHREAIKEIRETCMKELARTRETHAKIWDDFLQLQTRKRRNENHQQMPNLRLGGYKSYEYYDYGNASNSYINNMQQVEPRASYPKSENYPLRSNNNYDNFQHQR